MKLPAYTLLKQLIAIRELPLHEAKELLPRTFGDFRDWYPVAGLISQGYLANPFLGEPGERMSEREVASMLFGKTLGEGHHKVNNVTAVNIAESGSTITLSATSKADLYFAELRAKRIDRIVSAAVAIVIGVSSALLTFYAKEHLATEPNSSSHQVATPDPAVNTDLAHKAAQRRLP